MNVVVSHSNQLLETIKQQSEADVLRSKKWYEFLNNLHDTAHFYCVNTVFPHFLEQYRQSFVSL